VINFYKNFLGFGSEFPIFDQVLEPDFLFQGTSGFERFSVYFDLLKRQTVPLLRDDGGLFTEDDLTSTTSEFLADLVE
jgi:hypothetical protein